MWAAALIAAAFAADGPRAAVDSALDRIPPRCRLARTVRRVASLHDAGVAWADTLAQLERETTGLPWIHVVPNAAVLTAGLLYGAGDFTTTIALTVRGGLDTDSNGPRPGRSRGCCAARRPSRRSGPSRWRTGCAAPSSVSTGLASATWRRVRTGWRFRVGAFQPRGFPAWGVSAWGVSDRRRSGSAIRSSHSRRRPRSGAVSASVRGSAARRVTAAATGPGSAAAGASVVIAAMAASRAVRDSSDRGGPRAWR